MSAWSLMNHMAAADVDKLLAQQDGLYPPDEPRVLSRDKTAAVIHAALWAYGARAGSTAGGYAMMNLFDALGLERWTFKQPGDAA